MTAAEIISKPYRYAAYLTPRLEEAIAEHMRRKIFAERKAYEEKLRRIAARQNAGVADSPKPNTGMDIIKARAAEREQAILNAIGTGATALEVYDALPPGSCAHIHSLLGTLRRMCDAGKLTREKCRRSSATETIWRVVRK